MGNQYAQGWKPGDYALYSDFGFRSLVVVKVLPFAPEKPRTDVVHSPDHTLYIGSPGHMRFDPTSVRAEIVNNDLLNWDMGHLDAARSYHQPGQVHFYNSGNLYRDFGKLLQKESFVTPDVLFQGIRDIQKDYGWRALRKYGLDRWDASDLAGTGLGQREIVSRIKARTYPRPIPGRYPTLKRPRLTK